MGRKKGNRREQEAADIYRGAGYEVERSVQAHYGARSDWFGLADLMAVHPERRIRFVQVKSNRAAGIRAFFGDAEEVVSMEHVALDFLVCHDREGWRLLRPHDENNYQTVVDERGRNCPMGDGVRAWLQGVD